MGNDIQTTKPGRVWLRKAMLIIVVSLMPAMAMAQNEFAGGNGSEEEPYQIATWEHLDSVRVYLDAHFILMNDLDESTQGYTDYVKNIEGGENVVNDGQGWEPIGNFEEPFTGVFDGGEYTISGLTIDRSEIIFFEFGPLPIGLFGIVSPNEFGLDQAERSKADEQMMPTNGIVKNLTLNDADINGIVYVGGITGINEGLVHNVSVSGTIRGKFVTGGIAGGSSGIIIQASSTADVLFNPVILEDEEGNSIPIIETGGIGGIIGLNFGGVALSSSSGYVGYTEDDIDEIIESENEPSFSTYPLFGFGGLIGINGGFTGLGGPDVLGIVSTSYSTANVGGLLGTGGLIGINQIEDTFGIILKSSKSYYPFDLESYLSADTFPDYFGDMETLDVVKTYATGDVRGFFATGGLIGANGGNITESYSAGKVSLWDDEEIIIAAKNSEENESSVYEGLGWGGLIGTLENLLILGPFGPGEGQPSLTFNQVQNAINQKQKVNSSFDLSDEYSVISSFWDLQTSGVPVSAGGVGLSTREMKTISTYDDDSLVNRWDFESLWTMEEGYTSVQQKPFKSTGIFVSYPYFGNNPEAPLQTPAPGLSELANERVTVGSAKNTTVEESDLDFGGGESITILDLPSAPKGVLKLDGTEVEVDDEIQKIDVQSGGLVFESGFPARSISEYDFLGDGGIQYKNDIRTVTLSIDVAARSISYEKPEGWYFFASPSIGQTVGDLLDGIRTDGFPGSTNPGASFPTVYTIDQEAYEWEAVGNINQVLEQGQALLVYVFQEDLDELDLTFPELLLSNGPWLPLDGSFSFDVGYDPDQGPQGNSHFLIANPHPIEINICSSISRSERIANNYYIWRPSLNDNNGGYINILCGLEIEPQKLEPEPLPFDRPLRPLEGFWVRTTEENPSLDIREEDYGLGIRLLKSETRKEAEDENLKLRPLSLNLEHNDRNYAGSAHLLFSSHGSDDLDNYDAMHLSSAGLADRYLSVFAIDEENRKYNLQSLPQLTQDERVIPLGIETTEAGNYTFSWSVLSDTPAGVTYYLRDTKTESLTELEEGGRYSFSLSENEVASVEKTLNGERNINAKESAVTTHRFELIATMNELSSGIELPTDISLKQNYPNPFNPTTVIEYQLPQSAQVRLQVYDMAGRQVAELVNEQVSAGSHTINFDASNLSSGVYMYRLQAGATMLTRKLTVVK